MSAVGIDHAVVSVRDQMDHAADLYRRLGFTLTPRGFHKVGSNNHLMVFAHDYLELIGFPLGGEHLRPDLTASPIGLDGLVLQTSDADATYRDLIARGFAPDGPTTLARPIEIDGRAEEARFATVRFPREAIEGGRLYFCQHLTPQFVWRPQWMQHANGATGIKRFIIVVANPAREAARYKAMLGESVPEIELVTAAEFIGSFGNAVPDPHDVCGERRASYMAAVSIRITDATECARVLKANGVAYSVDRADRIFVAAHDAMNCTLVFEV